MSAFSVFLLFTFAYGIQSVPVDTEESGFISSSLMESTIQLMDDLYRDLGNPHTSAQDKENYAGQPVTYGEILPESIRSISSEFAEVPRNQTEFFDLGSGAGKMCLQEFLQNQWKRSVGVELVTRRYDMAVGMLYKLAKLLKEDSTNGQFVRHSFGTDAKITVEKPDDADAKVCFGNKERELCYINGDMTKIKEIGKAGGIFMCSTCFSNELLLTMMDNYFQHMAPGSVIISLRELPNIHDDLEKDHLALTSEFQQPMSWSKGDHVRVYKRLDDHSLKEEVAHTYTL